MASTFQPARYLLVGFGTAYRSRPVEFEGSLPATVPVCSLCRCVPSHHYTLGCKHVYCSDCFTDIIQTRTSSLRCPVDLKNLRPRKPVPKGRTESVDLGCLVAYCWNRENGCTYSGPLDDMTRHFDSECTFYEVLCSLCSKTMLRRDLGAHIEAAHVRTKRHAGGHHQAAGDTAVSMERDRAAAPPRGRRPANERCSKVSAGRTAGSPDAVSLDDDPTGSGDAQESISKMSCSSEQLQVLMEDVASRTAENIKRHSEKLFLELLCGIEVTNDHLLAFADGVRATFPVGQATAAASCSSPAPLLLQREEQVLKQFEWVVGNYARLRTCIHYVESAAFLIAPGYRIQIKARIDGIEATVLSASVKVHRAGGHTNASELLWPFERTCAFTLLHNSDDDGHVKISFAACDAFKEHDATTAESGVLFSSWLCIAKMDRNLFERDFVKDDAFTMLFSTA